MKRGIQCQLCYYRSSDVVRRDYGMILCGPCHWIKTVPCFFCDKDFIHDDSVSIEVKLRTKDDYTVGKFSCRPCLEASLVV